MRRLLVDSAHHMVDLLRKTLKLIKPARDAVVIRLSLGRRLVNLLPVAQRLMPSQMASSAGPWVVGREFESHVHHENAF